MGLSLKLKVLACNEINSLQHGNYNENPYFVFFIIIMIKKG